MKYWIKIGSVDGGPFTRDEIRTRYYGKITATTPCARVGKNTWATIGQLIPEVLSEEYQFGEVGPACADQTDSVGEPSKFQIEGHPLKCSHCGNDTFFTRQSLLNTVGMTFLKLDWLNRTAQNYICSRCGLITWFWTGPKYSS